MKSVDFKIGQSVKLIRADKCELTGKVTKRHSKGVIETIPSWRKDIVNVIFEGDTLPRCIFKSDLVVV